MCKISESNKESTRSRAQESNNGQPSSNYMQRRTMHFEGGPNQDI